MEVFFFSARYVHMHEAQPCAEVLTVVKASCCLIYGERERVSDTR